jgi:hypothetical protein
MITNGSISVYNDGVYYARFSISYTRNGISYSLSTDSFSINNMETLVIPNGSCCGYLIVKKQTFIGVWNEIFSLSFNLPYKKCFTVSGTTLNSDWKEGC